MDNVVESFGTTGNRHTSIFLLNLSEPIYDLFFSKKFKSKRKKPLKNNQICAVCSKKENEEHTNHKFVPMLFDFIIPSVLGKKSHHPLIINSIPKSGTHLLSSVIKNISNGNIIHPGVKEALD